MAVNLQAKMKNAASENPFYGKIALFDFYQKAQVGQVTDSVLNSAWNEVKGDKTLTELFWVIAFACGDIANRHHNALKSTSKLDQGGSAQRTGFQKILAWMRKNHRDQYAKFVTGDVIRQYTTLDNVLALRVKTKPGSKQVVENVNFLDGVDIDMVADYLAKIIRKGNPADNVLIAKFLTNVRTSKRQKTDRKTREKVSGGRELSDAVKKNMRLRAQLYTSLSEKMGWQVLKNEKFTDFSGLKAWKAQWNGELESVLFSTGKIVELDKTQFFELLNKLPSGARFRTRRRLLDKNNGLKGKWVSKLGKTDLGTWFLDWEKSKAALQDEQRVLAEKVRQGTASDADKAQLAHVTKSAKVNTGGTTLFEEFENLLTAAKSDREIDLQIQSMLDKIRFEVPILCVVDRSGSMASGYCNVRAKNGQTILPYKVAAFLATVAMLKNPSNEVDDLLISFGTSCDIITDNARGISKTNRFMQGREIKVDKLVDRTKPFSYNFTNIQNIVNVGEGGTDLSTVPKEFKKWIESDPDTRSYKIEQLQRYPVIVVISDGDLNNSGNAAQSMLTFRREMATYGWDGVVVVWDVNSGNPVKNKFDGVPNTMHVMGWNLGIINQIFTKIDDLDVIDTYLPLKALYESNRYELVKKNI